MNAVPAAPNTYSLYADGLTGELKIHEPVIAWRIAAEEHEYWAEPICFHEVDIKWVMHPNGQIQGRTGSDFDSLKEANAEKYCELRRN